MALPKPKPLELVGSERPRLAPPIPARTQVKDFEAAAKDIGMTLLPWQRTAARYMYALGTGEQWLYPEVAIVVARQNGKTELLLPHIMRRLAMGRRILHAAQTRELPRLLFNRVAWLIEAKYPKAKVRRGAGQETIELPNGGFYKITAASSGGPRGLTIDDLIPDEVRELDSDFLEAAIPTMTASMNPQVIYLSNAGEDDSTALNAIRLRADGDPSLAYLEWSAAPDLQSDDRTGWAQANPSLGHFPGQLAFLERVYRSHQLAGSLATFETEHLCRWVVTTRQQLVEPFQWAAGAGPLEAPARPSMACSMDPEGRRASAAVAWRRPDGSIGLRLTYDVTGSPIDTDRLGEDLRKDAARMGISGEHVGFDPLTDVELVKGFKKPKGINGRVFANATARFCNLVAEGKIRWADCDAVTDDLTWTARKVDTESGSYEAVRVKDDRPITASLAAIRAVWLASEPPKPSPKVM